VLLREEAQRPGPYELVPLHPPIPLEDEAGALVEDPLQQLENQRQVRNGPLVIRVRALQGSSKAPDHGPLVHDPVCEACEPDRVEGGRDANEEAADAAREASPAQLGAHAAAPRVALLGQNGP